MSLFLLINCPLALRAPSRAALAAGVSSTAPSLHHLHPSLAMCCTSSLEQPGNYTLQWQLTVFGGRPALGLPWEAAQPFWHPRQPLPPQPGDGETHQLEQESCPAPVRPQAAKSISHRLWRWFSRSSGDSFRHRGDENQFLPRRWQSALSCRINPGW